MDTLIEISMENKDRAFEKEDYYILDINVLVERKLKQRLI